MDVLRDRVHLRLVAEPLVLAPMTTSVLAFSAFTFLVGWWLAGFRSR